MAEKSQEYVCTLSPELVEKAQKELNEKPEWRSRDIQALRDMVDKHSGLKIRTDDAYLLRFLRAKKFDYDRAFNLILTHFKMKVDNEQIFTNLRPSAVKHVLEGGVTGTLATRDKFGRRVMIFRPGLRIRTDDAFLLRFLRAKKFNYDRAYNQLLTHYQMKVDNEPLFTNLRPSAVKHVLEDGVTGTLAHRDKFGRKVILMRPGKWDPSRYPIDDVFRTNFMTLSKIIQEEETQINGVVMVVDCKDIGWNHAKNISPFYAKRISSLLQDAFPARFKGLHYLNEPAIFDYIFAIMKQFLKEKTVNRLHFHGSNVSELKDFINEEDLPEEYGGKAPPYSNKEWADLLLQCDAEFDQEAKYGLVTPNSQTKARKEDAIDGTVGSFKKLNV